MKEWMRRFRAVYQEVKTTVLPHILPEFRSRRCRSDEKAYLLRNQVPVRLMIGKKQHVPDILYIERMSYNGATPWGRAALESDMLQNPKSLYYVLYEGHMPIAFLGARLDGKDIHITNLAVVPEFQQIGAATLLLQVLKGFADEKGAASISLEVRVSNHRAKALYTKMGFLPERIKQHYYHGDGEDALEMVWPLKEKQSEEKEDVHATHV
ncbi:ribosomal-protein-alanine N-acetyltransferase [Trichococcus ilyis]|uniref:Ribosomal-protein-alanine N-acetyltransferase n=2 Tax=Trichococcus ilyis TaxID=640938 RepID=A0A143Y9F9_9LACT|nr:ribosomal-protein-alanine acetyltransferase [Trichococcus ilyis]SEJ33331.1 ribosomal-protein-alanine N-acetyltransferase [Trichococcus ilyis]